MLTFGTDLRLIAGGLQRDTPVFILCLDHCIHQKNKMERRWLHTRLGVLCCFSGIPTVIGLPTCSIHNPLFSCVVTELSH